MPVATAKAALFLLLFSYRRSYGAASLPVENLDNAVERASASCTPVYKKMLTLRSELLQEARRARQDPSCQQLRALEAGIVRLESELANAIE
jgi:hypothetical protein